MSPVWLDKADRLGYSLTMDSNRVFHTAIITSIILHSALLVTHPQFSLIKKLRREDPIKINYVQEALVVAKELEQQRITIPKHELNAQNALKSIEKTQLPQPLKNRQDPMGKNPAFAPQPPAIKPLSIKPDIIAVKKKISLPPLDMEKMNNPSYISYYQLVREKIRRSAYQNYTRTETGEIYMTFVISQAGALLDVKLVTERSTPSYYLRETALRSIRDAVPFPQFPKELNYPQLSFNVIISFEIE